MQLISVESGAPALSVHSVERSFMPGCDAPSASSTSCKCRTCGLFLLANSPHRTNARRKTVRCANHFLADTLRTAVAAVTLGRTSELRSATRRNCAFGAQEGWHFPARLTHKSRLHSAPFPTFSSRRHTEVKRKILKGGIMSALKDRARARHSRVASIALDDLRALFHLPLQTAADELGISETMVKRVSRRFGVKKWPYRQIHWIDAQIDALKLHTCEDTEPPTSPRVRALELLTNARVYVLETGEVPPDLVQRLHRGVKTLARQETSPRSLEGWRTPSEVKAELEIEMEAGDAWGDEWSQSTASLSPRLTPPGCASNHFQHDLENDALLPNMTEEDAWGRVLSDEMLFEDPSMVLENVASYIFDPL